MCTATMTETIPVSQNNPLRKSTSQQEIMLSAATHDITQYRSECTVYGCNCREYVGANVGTCENCGHHYDSHRY